MKQNIYKSSLPTIDILFINYLMLEKKRSVHAKVLPHLERNNKKLHLPLDHVSADRLSLRFRLALERTLQGQADLAAMQCLLEVTLLTSFLGEDGFSLIKEQITDDAEVALYQILGSPTPHQNFVLTAKALKDLTIIVNEHDRQLREIRLEVLLKATARLEKLVQSGK